MLKRYALSDAQWERIKSMLPGQAGYVGANSPDTRLFVDAVLYRYRAGIPWRDLPERFGDFRNIHQRHTRWCQSGVWQRVFEVLASSADNEYVMIDSTIVKAHQHSAGGQKRGSKKLRRSDAAEAG
jgi:transposase